MKTLKVNKAKTKYSGEAAIIEDPSGKGCQFIIVAPTTGDIQRVLAQIAIKIKLDTRKCKTVTVTANDTTSS